MGKILSHNGNEFQVLSDTALHITDKLEPKTYVLKFDPVKHNGFYLELSEPFICPEKIYGNLISYKDRVLHSFTNRDSNTGVLLSGYKGNGKSLLAKLISNDAHKLGIATIIVNKSYGDANADIGEFLKKVSHPAVIIFDEFEKIFDKDDQIYLLSILDGLLSTKMLFILTCNDLSRINDHFKNRPGRILYNFDFNSVSDDTIKSYCQDNLNKDFNIQTETEMIFNIARFLTAFNFDQLKAIVAEMNMYNECAKTSVKYLNVKPDMFCNKTYQVVSLKRGNTKLPVYTKEIEFGFERGDGFYIKTKIGKSKSKTSIYFTDEEIISVSKDSRDIVFESCEEGEKLSYTLQVSYKPKKEITMNEFLA